jgi:uncharacterized protein YaaR (DUF327 family)
LRIQNHLKTNIEQVKKEKSDSFTKASFTDVMTHSKEKLQQQALNHLMGRIEAKGELLAKKRTIENVRDYKKLVKQFLEEAVSYGLNLNDKHGLQPNGRPKLYKIVEEVDKRLIQLTNQVMDEEKDGIEVLSLVGEIKGLLVNIYT